MSSPPSLPWKYRLASWYMAYIQNLNESPILTKSLTSGALGFLEEFSAQTIGYENGRNWQWLRMLRMGAYGSVVNAPLGHLLYELLAKFMEPLQSSPFASLIQLAASNLLILPLQTWVYLVSMGAFVDQKSWAETRKMLKKTFWPIMFTSWKYFPVIQLLVFKFLPPMLWVPFFNLLSLFFGIYVNLTAKSEEKKQN